MTETKPVSVGQSERFDLASDILGRGLRLLIARPLGEAPPAGEPSPVRRHKAGRPDRPALPDGPGPRIDLDDGWDD